jgi:hypothetical protein
MIISPMRRICHELRRQRHQKAIKDDTSLHYFYPVFTDEDEMNGLPDDRNQYSYMMKFEAEIVDKIVD